MTFWYSRARSTAAHCRHLPQWESGELEFGVKPPIVFVCAWSRNTSVSFELYFSLNVPVLYYTQCVMLVRQQIAVMNTYLVAGLSPFSGGALGRYITSG